MGDKLRNLRSGQSIDISGLILAEKRKGLVEKLFLVFLSVLTFMFLYAIEALSCLTFCIISFQPITLWPKLQSGRNCHRTLVF